MNGLYCSSAENYHPVLIASIILKVMQHILFSNIMQHLDKQLTNIGGVLRYGLVTWCGNATKADL